MDFREIALDAHRIAKEHGFHEKQDGEFHIPLKLMLIISEVSEAFEEYRRWPRTSNVIQVPDALVEELADVFIRLGDLVVFPEIGLDRFEQAVYQKMNKNEDRPYLHGGKRI